jgi:phenylpyruvate tautomerase PptA (4-oxalocrotonate tautomerase family)
LPNILVKLPKDSFPAQHREALVRLLSHAAASAEQIPDEPKKRSLCWVVVDEVAPGFWMCGGIDVTAQVLPCIAMIYVPAGVLDAAGRARFVKLVDDAFRQALPATDQRRLATSVIVHDVVEGTWGANGAIWRLPDFVDAVGFAHLKPLPCAS